MSVGATTGARGSFGVVGRPDLGTTKERTLVDEDRLNEQMREALEADTFIIYGKASVEQYDEDNPPQKIEMKAFGEELDGFLEDGIISRRHKDIPVGEPLGSYTLEEPAEVVVADEVLEFVEGDTLETGVRDDELWIVADLRNDSEIARETRMGAMTGDLTGFSVTVFCKEYEETRKGERVTSVDWHSTTIGGDEHIKNKDSRFGVAEFKALFGDDKFPGMTGKQSERAAIEVLRELPTTMSTEPGDTDDKGFWERVSDIASQKADGEADPEDGPESGKAEEEQADTPEDEKGDENETGDGEAGGEADEKAGEDDGPGETKSSDVDAVLERVKQDLGDEEAEVLEGAIEDEDEEEDELASEAEEGELKGPSADEVAEALAGKMQDRGFVTEEALDERFKSFEPDVDVEGVLEEKLEDRLPDEVASKAEVQDVINTAEEVITETLPEAQKAAAQDAVDEVGEKMATGETPNPSGGSAQDQVDYRQQIQSKFGSTGGNN